MSILSSNIFGKQSPNDKLFDLKNDRNYNYICTISIFAALSHISGFEVEFVDTQVPKTTLGVAIGKKSTLRVNGLCTVSSGQISMCKDELVGISFSTQNINFLCGGNIQGDQIIECDFEAGLISMSGTYSKSGIQSIQFHYQPRLKNTLVHNELAKLGAFFGFPKCDDIRRQIEVAGIQIYSMFDQEAFQIEMLFRHYSSNGVFLTMDEFLKMLQEYKNELKERVILEINKLLRGANESESLLTDMDILNQWRGDLSAFDYAFSSVMKSEKWQEYEDDFLTLQNKFVKEINKNNKFLNQKNFKKLHDKIMFLAEEAKEHIFEEFQVKIDKEQTYSSISRAQECIKEDRCTFLGTGNFSVPGNFVQCLDCNGNTEKICEVCAKSCHEGHNLKVISNKSGHCKCHQSGSCKKCYQLVPDLYMPELAEEPAFACNDCDLRLPRWGNTIVCMACPEKPSLCILCVLRRHKSHLLYAITSSTDKKSKVARIDFSGNFTQNDYIASQRFGKLTSRLFTVNHFAPVGQYFNGMTIELDGSGEIFKVIPFIGSPSDIPTPIKTEKGDLDGSGDESSDGDDDTLSIQEDLVRQHISWSYKTLESVSIFWPDIQLNARRLPKAPQYDICGLMFTINGEDFCFGKSSQNWKTFYPQGKELVGVILTTKDRNHSFPETFQFLMSNRNGSWPQSFPRPLSDVEFSWK